MDLYHDLADGFFTTFAGSRYALKSIRMKRGDILPLRIGFRQAGEVTTLPSGYSMRFVIKAGFGAAAVTLAEATAWAFDSETSLYSSTLNLQGSALLTLLGEEAELSLYCEVTVSTDDWGPFTSARMTCMMENDLYKGDEDPPVIVDGHTHSLGDITQSGASTGQVVRWSGTGWAAESLGTAATANSSDLLNRANHTGTQLLATISDAGTAAARNVGTAEGDLPALGAGGLIPVERLPAASLTQSLSVADEAARLALSSAAATGKIVVEADSGKSFGLVSGGDPAVSGDWLQLGDRDIQMADVYGLTTALSAKVDTTTTISGGGLVTGGGDLSTNRTLTVTEASDADMTTGTDGTKAATPRRITTWLASLLSTVGGVLKIPKLDAYGNLYLAPLVTDATAAAEGSGPSGEDGNLILRNGKFVGWYASDGSGIVNGAGQEYAKIRYDRNHSPNGEWNFDASARVCWYWNDGYQFGNANGGTHYIYLHSGYASAGTTMRQSVPLALNTMTWDGAASLLNRMVIQAHPLDATGTNSELAIYQNATMGSAQDMSGVATFVAGIAAEGVRSAGTSPAPVALTDGATITQTCSVYKTVQRASVTLGGNRTLAISGAVSGMRGILYIKQDATGSRTLTLPTNHYKRSDWALSTTAFEVDLIEWDYDGTNFYFTIKNGLDVNYDAAALAFFTAASITDSVQKHALNDRVAALKAAGLWTKIEADYPMVGGNATAHSKDLKAAHNITWNGTLTHDANGVTGDGSSGYGDTGINLSTLGLTNSAGGYVYCKTSSPTDGGYFFGATDAGGGRFGLSRSGTAGLAQGVNDGTASQNYTADGDFRRQWMVQRSDSANKQIMRDAIYSTEATASTAAPNRNVYLLCRNSAGSAANFSNANIATHTVFNSPLSESEWTTFRTIDAAFQTALNRANP